VFICAPMRMTLEAAALRWLHQSHSHRGADEHWPILLPDLQQTMAARRCCGRSACHVVQAACFILGRVPRKFTLLTHEQYLNTLLVMDVFHLRENRCANIAARPRKAAQLCYTAPLPPATAAEACARTDGQTLPARVNSHKDSGKEPAEWLLGIGTDLSRCWVNSITLEGCGRGVRRHSLQVAHGSEHCCPSRGSAACRGTRRSRCESQRTGTRADDKTSQIKRQNRTDLQVAQATTR
jgi:hypothetical protein